VASIAKSGPEHYADISFFARRLCLADLRSVIQVTAGPAERIARPLRKYLRPLQTNGSSIEHATLATTRSKLRVGRVPIRTKLIALGIGGAGVGAIELLQLPVEGVVAALLPLIGAAGDLALDGAEAVIGPVLIATLLLPHLAPADLVQQIRAETERMAHA
jgi:hypothetical protein